jgi:tetratricopeptide (TPR) repeat protein
MAKTNRNARRASAKQVKPDLATGNQRSTAGALVAIPGGAEQPASRPEYEAQDLIYDAWEATGARRAALARQALELWPDCADAYVLLAQETTSNLVAQEMAANLEEARELLERGVAAGERTLGRRVFEQDVGHFWLVFETRPYMRARAALAATLWRLGRLKEAVEHQRELLRLNPNDNQGLRYRQAHWLLTLECFDELDELFVAYADDGAPGLVYTRALAAFARRGEDAGSRGLLAQARELNPHVPAYLTGHKTLPEQRPAYTVFGEETEAIDYAAGAGELWTSVPGALAWLAS